MKGIINYIKILVSQAILSVQLKYSKFANLVLVIQKAK